MKRLLLPLVLISFSVICLSIVHIDNVNKLESQSIELRKKHKTKVYLDDRIENTTSVDAIKTK